MKWNEGERERNIIGCQSREIGGTFKSKAKGSMVLILIFGFNLFISLNWTFNLAFRLSKITFTDVILFLFSN